jgi:hypothetical protein
MTIYQLRVHASKRVSRVVLMQNPGDLGAGGEQLCVALYSIPAHGLAAHLLPARLAYGPQVCTTQRIMICFFFFCFSLTLSDKVGAFGVVFNFFPKNKIRTECIQPVQYPTLRSPIYYTCSWLGSQPTASMACICTSGLKHPVFAISTPLSASVLRNVDSRFVT